MSDITLEKTHALLEKLAEYMMNELPTRREVDARFVQMENRLDRMDSRLDRMDSRLDRMDSRLEQMAEKKDLERVEEKVNRLLEGIDHQAKEIDDFRIEKKAISYTLDVHEERIGALEEHNLGYRVRDKDGMQSKKL